MRTRRVSVLELAPGRRVRESERCESCGERTSERKPYCLAHLERLPYVQSLASELAQRETEAAAAASRRWRSIDPHGTRAAEIVEVLAQKGRLTPAGLAREVDLDAEIIEAYLTALARARRVVVRELRTSRGRQRFVFLLSPEHVA